MGGAPAPDEAATSSSSSAGSSQGTKDTGNVVDADFEVVDGADKKA
jgi:hypothetical protein